MEIVGLKPAVNYVTSTSLTQSSLSLGGWNTLSSGTINIVSTGRPMIVFISNGAWNSTGDTGFRFLLDGVTPLNQVAVRSTTGIPAAMHCPPFVPSPGTRSISLQYGATSGLGAVESLQFTAMEL